MFDIFNPNDYVRLGLYVTLLTLDAYSKGFEATVLLWGISPPKELVQYEVERSEGRMVIHPKVPAWSHLNYRS